MNAAMALSFSPLQLKPEVRDYAFASSSSSSPPSSYGSSVARGSSSNVKFLSAGARRPIVLCNGSVGPGGSGSGESESRNVLDAFFLGKALAEALNERLESTIGEVLSTVGRLQAEQQKQVQDFQEEVFERAKRAKERAARESIEAPGLVAKSTATGVTPVTVAAASSSQPSPSSITASNTTYSEPDPPSSAPGGSPETEDPAFNVPNED